MPDTEGDLPVRHEMPRQLAEHRLVLEGLVVDLHECQIIRPDREQAIRKGRTKKYRPGAALLYGALCGTGSADVPAAVTSLIFVEHTQHIVDDAVWVGLGHQPHLLGEGMRRVGKLLCEHETRIARNSGVVRQEGARVGR